MLAKSIYVSSCGVVAGPFPMEDALSYMRSLAEASVAVDSDMVVYAVSQGSKHSIERIDERNDSILNRTRMEALA